MVFCVVKVCQKFFFAEKSSGSSCRHCQRCLRYWKFHFHELDWHLGIDFIAASGRRFERNPSWLFFSGWCDQKGAYLHAALCWRNFVCILWSLALKSHGIIPPVSCVWMNFIQESFIFLVFPNMPYKHPVESPNVLSDRFPPPGSCCFSPLENPRQYGDLQPSVHRIFGVHFAPRVELRKGFTKDSLWPPVPVRVLGCPRKLGSMVRKWVITPIYPIYR